MRDPSSPQFQEWNRLAATGDMTGRNRPVGRVTISKQSLRSIQSNRPGPWRYSLFQGSDPEIPNVLRSITINRSLGDDAATCTIVMSNDYMQHYAYSPQGIDTGIGRPGYLTFNRGDNSPMKQKSIYNQFVTGEPGVTQFQGFEHDENGNRIAGGLQSEPFPTEWGYPRAGSGDSNDQMYYERLIPNRLVRTFQGYGSDNMDDNGQMISVHEEGYVHPRDDTKLVVTGHWLIDSVEFSADGQITVQCRDLAKVLLEQVVYPPLIPLSRFPLVYCPETPPSGEKGGISQNLAQGYDASSNDVRHEKNKALWGHRPSHAFDGHPGSFWISTGNKVPSADYSFEWIQTRVANNTINEVLLTLNNGITGTGPVCYVSVMENGVWQGSETVPYNPNAGPSYPNGANIPYVLRTTVGSETEHVIKLPRAYKAQKVRVCFTNLPHIGPRTGPNQIGTFHYRASVREFKVRYNKPDTYKAGTIGQPQYISDWSQAVKELCAWAGLTWPTDHNVATGVHEPTPIRADPLIGVGINGEDLRVWGDFEVLGAGPVECTPSEFFLNKSFKECINLIRDFLGCIFFIDESGGAQFRFPNLFTGGNFVVEPPTGSAVQDEHSVRIEPPYLKKTWPIEFHENANLLSYSVSINDSQVRSEILVVGTNPDTNSAAPLAAGVVLGNNSTSGTTSAVNFTNVLGGQYRLFLVPGSASAGFKTVEECQRMAELIGLKILHSYRKGTAQIMGHPGLQLDDQVRIFERVTNEYNVHYVSGINSKMDIESGEYLMEVTTHWLGDDPDRDWFLDHVQLTPAVKNLPALLKRIGEAAQEVPGPGGSSNDPATGNTSGR